MSRSFDPELLDERLRFTLRDMCRICGVPAEFLMDLVQEGVIAPLEHLLGPAFERYPGAKLLDAELEEHKDRPVRYIYEIELLTVEGVVREIELDANTGQLLKDKEDD